MDAHKNQAIISMEDYKKYIELKSLDASLTRTKADLENSERLKEIYSEDLENLRKAIADSHTGIILLREIDVSNRYQKNYAYKYTPVTFNEFNKFLEDNEVYTPLLEAKREKYIQEIKDSLPKRKVNILEAVGWTCLGSIVAMVAML